MCGRFTLHFSREMFETLFNVTTPQELSPRYNIAPSQLVPVIRTYADDSRHLDLLRWGLIPSWARDEAIGHKLINARAETAQEKPSFRSALRYRRCVIPASGFYEWQVVEGKKAPRYITRSDQSPFAFAGLWDTWRNQDRGETATCAILTTGANRLLAPLHDRMPVILKPMYLDLWLNRSVTSPGQLAYLFEPYDDDTLTVIPVSPLVNNPAHDTPACIAPLDPIAAG
jgi:putative SOS response-associated peptidase YedK